MTDAPADRLLGALLKGETVLVWSRCRHEGEHGILALTSDRVLFLADSALEASVAQRIAQSRTMRVQDGLLQMKTAAREVNFAGLEPQVIHEIVGTLGRKVKVSDPVIAERIKAHRKRVKKRAIHSILNVPKDAVGPDPAASAHP
jgi:hypothetical protein